LGLGLRLLSGLPSARAEGAGRVRLANDYSEIRIRLKFAPDAPAPNYEVDYNKPPTMPKLVVSVDAMAEIHNRMPVILDDRDRPKWLGEEPATEQELLALLRPCPDERLTIWRVDNKVGNVLNTGPELILPLEDTLL
jgi:hypothetical protein